MKLNRTHQSVGDRSPFGQVSKLGSISNPLVARNDEWKTTFAKRSHTHLESDKKTDAVPTMGHIVQHEYIRLSCRPTLTALGPTKRSLHPVTAIHSHSTAYKDITSSQWMLISFYQRLLHDPKCCYGKRLGLLPEWWSSCRRRSNITFKFKFELSVKFKFRQYFDYSTIGCSITSIVCFTIQKYLLLNLISANLKRKEKKTHAPNV